MPFKFRSNLRCRYENLARFPAQYLVMGDAVCSFNPFYGQGMSVAALEGLALDRCLTDAPRDGQLWSLFFGAIARVVDTPWTIASGSDFAFDGVTTNVQVQDWAARLGVSASEIVRRLESKGRERLADTHAQIEAVLADWGRDGDAAADRAARIPIAGAASAVWTSIARRKPNELDEKERSKLGKKLRKLAAATYERFLQREENVTAVLAETDAAN